MGGRHEQRDARRRHHRGGGPGEGDDRLEDAEDAEDADRQCQVAAAAAAMTHPVRDAERAEQHQRPTHGPLQGQQCLAHDFEYDLSGEP
jgi:hypothetical protein